MSVLKQFIESDLESLYHTNLLKNAEKLNKNLNGSFFSANDMPMYFAGKIDAETVFVMLNPGKSIDNSYSFFEKEKNKYKSFEEFLNTYIENLTNIGEIDKDRLDNFDVKQAAFLYHFENSGIKIPDFFSKESNTKENKLSAKLAVCSQKLQLELIPYCSREFVGFLDSQKLANENCSHFSPFVWRLLDIITSSDRKYVLFGSKQFYFLFKALEKTHPEIFTLHQIEKFKIEGLKNNVSSSIVKIRYNEKVFHGIIPFSFPRRDLPNAFEKMSLYGKHCFDQLQKFI
jgi:hypothetical protein